jgi:hypothetical protein
MPNVVWGNGGLVKVEDQPVKIFEAAPCGVHEEENEFNPFTCFNEEFEFSC